MKEAVIDASVVLRWAFEDEADRAGALRIEQALRDGRVHAVEPPLFLFEVASTLERGTRQSGRRWIATGFAAIFALVMTLDTARWYRQLGWLDGVRPVRVPLNDRAFQWLSQHPEVDAIYGGYWDVYRLAFLRGGTLKAVPFPEYPVRFPEWRDQFPGDRPPILIARPDRLGSFNRAKALSEGARILDESPDLAILDWPNR